MYKHNYVRGGLTAILMMSRGVYFKVHYLSRVLVKLIGSNNCVTKISVSGTLIFALLWGCMIIYWNSPICKLTLAYLDQLCVPWRYQKLQRRASVDSRVLSSS